MYLPVILLLRISALVLPTIPNKGKINVVYSIIIEQMCISPAFGLKVNFTIAISQFTGLGKILLLVAQETTIQSIL